MNQKIDSDMLYRNYRWLATEVLSVAVLDYKKAYNKYNDGLISYNELMKEKKDSINSTTDLFAEIILDCDMERLLEASEKYESVKGWRKKYR